MQLRVPAFIASPLTLIASTAGLAIYGANEVFVKPENQQAQIAKTLEVRELHDKQKNPPMIHGIRDAWNWVHTEEGKKALEQMGLKLDPTYTKEDFINFHLEATAIGGLEPYSDGRINYVVLKNIFDEIAWSEQQHGETIKSFISTHPDDNLVKKYLGIFEEIQSPDLKNNPERLDTLKELSITLNELRTRSQNYAPTRLIHQASVQARRK